MKHPFTFYGNIDVPEFQFGDWELYTFRQKTHKVHCETKHLKVYGK
jgi:hypothetical protein